MKKKRLIYAFCIGVTSLVVTAGVAFAATHDITGFLGGQSGDMFDVKGTMLFDSIKVGRQGTGGVTFFNGTIINNTTGTGGADNPVTFGDNVRIDGRVYRGATAGTTDNLPLIVNDNMEVAGSLTAGSLSTGALTTTSLVGSGIVSSGNLADSAVTSAKISDSTITTSDIANGTIGGIDLANDSITSLKIVDDSITSAKIQNDTIATEDMANESVSKAYSVTANTTTTNSTTPVALGDALTIDVSSLTNVLIMFSGTFSNSQNGGYTEIGLSIDGENYSDATRMGTSNTAGDKFCLSFMLSTDFFEDGEHTIQVTWATSSGSVSLIYNNSLQVINFKR